MVPANPSPLLSPVVYALSACALCFATIVAIAALENTIGLHTWKRVGDIDTVLITFIGGAFLFSLVTRYLVKLEKLAKPGVTDHLRHSALLYLAMIASSVGIIVLHKEASGALSFAYVCVVLAVSLLGIVINACNLKMIGKKHAPNV
jgi:hypothetical protein